VYASVKVGRTTRSSKDSPCVSLKVAALVYKHNNHIINLFLWPSSTFPSKGCVTTRQGYHLITWTQPDLTYWAVSDLETGELQNFVRLIQHQTSPT
jgi:anti-sigma factor RsiW